MSRRNFILLIVILTILIIVGVILYSTRTPSNTNTGGGGSSFTDIFGEFGTGSNTSGGGSNTPTDVSQGEDELGAIATAKLVRVSSLPVAGYSVIQRERPAGVFIPTLRYVDRITGNIYQTFADTIAERKITETLIPQVYEAYLSDSGDGVFMRYLKSNNKTISTFASKIPKEKDDGSLLKLESTFILDDILSLSVAPDKSKVFYLLQNGESVIGTIFELSTNKKAQIFDSAFTEWISEWPSSKMITLTTKASSRAMGYMYAINIDRKDLNKVLGGIYGLTTLTSPDGKLVLYGDNTLSLFILNTETKSVSQLGVRGLPEKCVWSKNGSSLYCATPINTPIGLFPDSWYQGETAFADQIYQIDTENLNATLVVNPTEEVDRGLDIIKMELEPSGIYLFFVNKTDSTLWKVNLK